MQVRQTQTIDVYILNKSTMAQSFVLIVIVLATFSTVQGYAIKSGCVIRVNGDLPHPQPLLLKPDGSNDGFGFHLPSTSDGLVTIPSGELIRLACPGSSNHLMLFPDLMEVTAMCATNTYFIVDDASYNFTELACKSNPSQVAKPSGQTCYKDNAISIDIGFEVGTEFFKTIDICFDEAKRNTLYSQFDLVAGIGGYEVGFPRPGFVADNFFPGISIDSHYTRTTQRETISKILGSTSLGEMYIDETSDYYIARGHLTAKTDFVFGSQQRATFHYINVAPQWQTFNAANWNSLEHSVRLYASDHALDLKVYTGTHGVTTLPNVNNIESELYIYVDENGNVAVPVPKLFWKVIYNPKTEEGVAFLGVNNPYIPDDKLGADYKICTDVCSKVSWINWKPTDVKMGIAYCCDVNEFRETVDTLPPFEVSGLLT